MHSTEKFTTKLLLIYFHMKYNFTKSVRCYFVIMQLVYLFINHSIILDKLQICFLSKPFFIWPFTNKFQNSEIIWQFSTQMIFVEPQTTLHGSFTSKGNNQQYVKGMIASFLALHMVETLSDGFGFLFWVLFVYNYFLDLDLLFIRY